MADIAVYTTIQEGQVITTPSLFTEMEQGEVVNIYSAIGHWVGAKPIARGTCISHCGDDPKAPIAPALRGARHNAWRGYYNIRVDKIF